MKNIKNYVRGFCSKYKNPIKTKELQQQYNDSRHPDIFYNNLVQLLMSTVLLGSRIIIIDKKEHFKVVIVQDEENYDIIYKNELINIAVHGLIVFILLLLTILSYKVKVVSQYSIIIVQLINPFIIGVLPGSNSEQIVKLYLIYELFAIQCILKMGYDSITTTISAVLGELIAMSLVANIQYSQFNKYMNQYYYNGLPMLFNTLWAIILIMRNIVLPKEIIWRQKMEFLQKVQIKIMKESYENIFDKLTQGLMIVKIDKSNSTIIDQHELNKFDALKIKYVNSKIQDFCEQSSSHIEYFDPSSFYLYNKMFIPYEVGDLRQIQDSQKISIFDIVNQHYQQRQEKNYFLIQINRQSSLQDSIGSQFNQLVEVQAVEIEFYNVKFEEEDCILLQLKNITQILNSEKEKLQTHYQDMLIATISHEVMNPLNSIVNLSSIAENQYQNVNEDNSQEAFDLIKTWLNFFQIINSSSKQVYYLVKSCMDIKLIKNNQFTSKVTKQKPIEIIRNIYNIFRMQINDKQIKFKIDYNDDLQASYTIDWDRYQQILINIMQNAVKFTLKGSISVSVQIDQIENGFLMITTKVQDTGVGMSEEILNNLFLTFSNNQSQDPSALGKNGIGVGLSICYDLISALNGEISVESTLDQGTQVTFALKFFKKQKQILNDRSRTKLSKKLTSHKINQNRNNDSSNNLLEIPQQKPRIRMLKPKNTPNFCDNDNSQIYNKSSFHLLDNQEINLADYQSIEDNYSSITKKRRGLQDFIDVNDINLLLASKNTFQYAKQRLSLRRNATEIRNQEESINAKKSLINQAQNQCMFRRNESQPLQIINIYNPYLQLIQPDTHTPTLQTSQGIQRSSQNQSQNLLRQNQRVPFNKIYNQSSAQNSIQESARSNASMLEKISEFSIEPKLNELIRKNFDNKYQFLNNNNANLLANQEHLHFQKNSASNLDIIQISYMNCKLKECNIESSNEVPNYLTNILAQQSNVKYTFGLKQDSNQNQEARKYELIVEGPQEDNSILYDRKEFSKEGQANLQTSSFVNTQCPQEVQMSSKIEGIDDNCRQQILITSTDSQEFDCNCQNKILIVDDNIFNLITLELMLKDQSELIVDKANNGLEAVEMFKRNLLNKECCNQHYRLILMDLNMPVMDGYEATEQIIQVIRDNQNQECTQDFIDSQISIVACTAFVNDENINHCFQVGMKQVLNKPVNQCELLKVVKKYMKK
eukprot:403366216